MFSQHSWNVPEIIQEDFPIKSEFSDREKEQRY